MCRLIWESRKTRTNTAAQYFRADAFSDLVKFSYTACSSARLVSQHEALNNTSVLVFVLQTVAVSLAAFATTRSSEFVVSNSRNQVEPFGAVASAPAMSLQILCDAKKELAATLVINRKASSNNTSCFF